MTLYKRREKFSGLSARLGRIFGSAGLTANNYTALALIFVVISAYFIISGNFLCAALFFAIASFFDVVDGSVARFQKKESKSGAYLDSVSDRYVEGIFAVALALVALPAFYLPAFFWIMLYLFGSMMTTYARAVAAEKSITKDLRGGLLERSDRLILLFVGIVLGYFAPVYLTYVIIILAVLANVSALQRIRIGLNSAGKK